MTWLQKAHIRSLLSFTAMQWSNKIHLIVLDARTLHHTTVQYFDLTGSVSFYTILSYSTLFFSVKVFEPFRISAHFGGIPFCSS